MSDRDKLKETVSEAMKDRATTWGGLTKWDELAEAALATIENAGYVIVPRYVVADLKRYHRATQEALIETINNMTDLLSSKDTDG